MPDRTKFQTFEMQTFKRSQINRADYNPRIMDTYAATRLRNNIKRNGLVEPLIINKRSMNLLSGHQRLRQLDELEKGKDYDLQMAVVDLDEKAEREMNVFLNNQEVQGDWDLAKLKEVLADIDLDKAGFSQFDIELLFEDSGMSPTFAENPVQAKILSDAERAMQMAQENQRKKDRKKEREYGGDANYDPEYFAIVTFETEAQKEAFFALIGLDPPTAAVDGRLLEKYIGS